MRRRFSAVLSPSTRSSQLSCARLPLCRSCGKMNHFARCCRSKPIRPSFAESSPPRPQSRFQPPPPNSFPPQPPPREIRHVTDTQQYPISEDEYLFTVTISQVIDLLGTNHLIFDGGGGGGGRFSVCSIFFFRLLTLFDLFCQSEDLHDIFLYACIYSFLFLHFLVYNR